MSKNNLMKIGGVWAKTNEDGSTSLFGRFNWETKILILPNKYRKDDSEPSHVIFLTPTESKPGGKHQPAQNNSDKQGGRGSDEPPLPEEPSF